MTFAYRMKKSLKRFWVEEALQHICGDARHVVVVAIVGQGGAPRDRAGGEHPTAARRLEEQEIGTHPGVLGAAHHRMVERRLLGTQEVELGVVLRTGNHQGVGWRAKFAVSAVEFDAGCAAEQRPEIADQFVFADALEDETCTWVAALGCRRPCPRQ